MGAAPVPAPRALSPDEIELLKKQRDLVLPSARLAAYDDFAKWLFTTITVVGTLAAAFSSTALKGLSSVGAVLFFTAVGLVGLSLAVAVILRGIEPRNPNWQSLEDMLQKSKDAVSVKRVLAWVAGGLFAVAIFLAALAPIFSSEQRMVPVPKGLTLTFGPNGVHAIAKMGAKAKGLGDIRITALTDKEEKLIGTQYVKDSVSDSLTVDITSAPVPPKAKSVRVYVSCAGEQAGQPAYIFALSSKFPTPAAPQSDLVCFK